MASNQEAGYSVFPRAGRKFYYVYFIDPLTGKRLPARSSQKTSEAAALRWAKEEYKKLVEGQPDSDITLGKYATPFFSDECAYIKRRRDEGKKFSARYKKNSRRYVTEFILKDKIADIKLKDLRRSHIVEFRGRMVDLNGVKDINARIMQTLKLILNEAVYNEYLQGSPADLVKKPINDKKTRTAISIDSVIKILRPELYDSPYHWAATFCAAYTGMRAAEIRALTWTKIDLEKHIILVDEAFKGDGHEVGSTKNGKARVVAMSPGLEKMLKEWKKHSDGKWVFGFSENRPLGYKAWNESVKNAAASAGCPGVTLHVLRHTLNTHLRGSGANDILLRAHFGWSGSDIQDNYTHAEVLDYQPMGKMIDVLLKGETKAAK